MDEPKSLDSLFKEKIFRIPDYQRGYAWKHEQLKPFWEDLINLPDGRMHYTGVLTLREIPANAVKESDKEFWLIEDYSYKQYHIVDGQQRLTTFIIFLQSFVNFFKALPENAKKSDDTIYVSDTLSLAALQSKYLFRIKPVGDHFRTYKFGYTTDNPSYDYLRYKILDEPGAGLIQETFYTLNLSNAKEYFSKQFEELYAQDGKRGLQDVYSKLTKRFLFNEYIIKDEFDVFVAFETMNNRGKKLSDLELLKNRLIYLTTLYDDRELNAAGRKSLREAINDSWKEVYYQLGRNKTQPLNDDDFLKAHWTMYFKYSRQTGRDYIDFLLNQHFTPQKVHKKVERAVELEVSEEQRSETDFDEPDDVNQNQPEPEEAPSSTPAQLTPKEIRDFVLSLKESVVHWFNTFHPYLAQGLSPKEKEWIDRINRVGVVYFRPLLMAILKKNETPSNRVRLFKDIERFIFIAFRLGGSRANYKSSEFNNAARAIDGGESGLDAISERLEKNLSYMFHEDKSLRVDEFYNLLYKKFDNGSGYYGWTGIRYFLYEYESKLLSAGVQKKVDWDDLLKSEKDKISIEHIYPQTETSEWAKAFKGYRKTDRAAYSASLGNLLLLSSAINSSLQNDGFEAKKNAKFSAGGQRLRHGFYDGSHSEIEVSQMASWGPNEVRERGNRLLKFMEERWGFEFQSDEDRAKLLFLKIED
jgi:uncharacterized protein with ParB-like and HNH nuclease domain